MKTGKIINPHTRLPGRSKEKGASSLEYIMLAGVLVAILAVVSTTGVGRQITNFFTEIFTYATDHATGGGG